MAVFQRFTRYFYILLTTISSVYTFSRGTKQKRLCASMTNPQCRTGVLFVQLYNLERLFEFVLDFWDFMWYNMVKSNSCSVRCDSKHSAWLSHALPFFASVGIWHSVLFIFYSLSNICLGGRKLTQKSKSIDDIQDELLSEMTCRFEDTHEDCEKCMYCSFPIFPNETMVRVGVTGDIIHKKCWNDYADEYFYELCELLGEDFGEGC